MTKTLGITARVLPLLTAIGLVACADVRELSGVYVEDFVGPVPEDRAYALRLTIFEHESWVGGWVEYYGQDQLNSAESPFVLPTYCAYFGPFRRPKNGMVMRAPSPLEDSDLQLSFERENRKHLRARIEVTGGIFAEGAENPTETTYFRLMNESPAVGCPESAELITRPLTGFQRKGADE